MKIIILGEDVSSEEADEFVNSCNDAKVYHISTKEGEGPDLKYFWYFNEDKRWESLDLTYTGRRPPRQTILNMLKDNLKEKGKLLKSEGENEEDEIFNTIYKTRKDILTEASEKELNSLADSGDDEGEEEEEEEEEKSPLFSFRSNNVELKTNRPHENLSSKKRTCCSTLGLFAKPAAMLGAGAVGAYGVASFMAPSTATTLLTIGTTLSIPVAASPLAAFLVAIAILALALLIKSMINDCRADHTRTLFTWSRH
jgi:hypothetical protein